MRSIRAFAARNSDSLHHTEHTRSTEWFNIHACALGCDYSEEHVALASSGEPWRLHCHRCRRLFRNVVVAA